MRVNGQYIEEIGVGIRVLLLFILVLEALSREFLTGLPRKLLYANDLAVNADSLEEFIAKLST